MTDHICQLRESSHTYLYISLSMSTNVWSSLACETMCGRGHEYYVRGNPFVCFCTCTIRYAVWLRCTCRTIWPVGGAPKYYSNFKKKAHVVLEVVSLRPSCYWVVHASAALLQGPDYSSAQGGARYSAKFCICEAYKLYCHPIIESHDFCCTSESCWTEPFPLVVERSIFVAS